MAKSAYHDLAKSLAFGDWEAETPLPNWGNALTGKSAPREEIKIACLIDIMLSLRAISSKLSCRTLQQAVHAIPEIKKAVTKKKRKPKPRNRLKPSRN